MSVFRAALRISRRDALRFKGRTALIMVMIGLPVLVITAVLTGAATTDLTLRETLSSTLGAADARIDTIPARTPIKQNYDGGVPNQPLIESSGPPWTPAEINKLLDGRLLRYQSNVVDAKLADGWSSVEVFEADLRDPMTSGMRALVEGRFPAAPGEVAVSPEMVDRGARIGGTIQVWRPDRTVRVVGVVAHPNRPGLREMVALPEGLLPHQNDGNSSGWLIDTRAPVQWADIRRLNDQGLVVLSRAVVESATPDETGIADFAPDDGMRGLAWLGIAVVLIITETVLLAGPAFAVGLRRRRRELAVIAAQGADGPQLQTIVLADGLVLGGAAALLGAALGIGAGAVAEGVAARVLDWQHGPLDVPWSQVLGVAFLGLISGLTAALVPAVQASRQSPAQVLAGRAAVDTRERAGRPMVGIVLVVLGLGGSVYAVSHGVLSVAASAVLLVLGLVALMPWLVRATGGLAARLPLALRLSVRDASRHRVRTASAAAAVMAATMGAVTLGIGASSSYAAREAARDSVVPVGTMTIRAHDATGPTWARLRAAVQQSLPGVSLVEGLEPEDTRGRNVLLTVGGRNCGDRCSHGFYAPVPVGDERLLALLQGRRDPQAAAALAAGKVVAFDPAVVRDGMVELNARYWNAEGATSGKVWRVPAVVARGADANQGGVIVPAGVLAQAGFKAVPRTLYAAGVTVEELPLQTHLRVVGAETAYINLERGYDEDRFFVLLILLGAALVLVLGGTFAATGLAAADMRQDLDTLSAVGGAPRVRRLVVAAQAAYISGLGALVGLPAGAVSGIVATWPLTREGFRQQGDPVAAFGPTTIDVPWLFLAGVVIGLPLLAALVAGAFTRTRLVLARRVA
ncbi:FtsX-like permease family protein [Nonomuraea sp. SYSU D8015]|uniref:FtsX-like permease family protein n=1 Tax=Nonomuraea sp. SYSU D8015 TaxID=2593644 RepID=UPI0016615E45|nr:FtsX-like permease family protein [Nonomuraea sp. SYSU D8015]